MRDLARRALASSPSPESAGALARIGEAESDAPSVAALLAARREPLAHWWRGKPPSTPGWRFAAEVLARGGDRDAVARLVSASAAGDPAAAAALVRAGEDAVPRLRDLFGSPAAAQRRAALEAVAEIPGRAALDALLAAVSRADLRERALDALAARGGPTVVDDLVGLLRRGESERLVLATLVKLGDARAIPALEALRASPSLSSEVNRALRALRAART
jgi:HEAT repeat protein